MTTGVIKNRIGLIQYKEKTIFWSLFFISILLLSSYGFLVVKSITNGIHKDAMQKKMISLNSNVNSLEFEYLNMKNDITLSFAESHGFIAVTNTNYVALSSDTRNSSLSVNKN